MSKCPMDLYLKSVDVLAVDVLRKLKKSSENLKLSKCPKCLDVLTKQFFSMNFPKMAKCPMNLYLNSVDVLAKSCGRFDSGRKV